MLELFRVKGLPTLQNRLFNSSKDAIDCIRGDVTLVQSLVTGLIFNSAFNHDLLAYDEHYENEQSCSSVFRAHLEQVSRIIEQYGRGSNLVEIGCGKG